MSIEKINQLAKSILKAAEGSEKLAIPAISVKLERMAKENPYDQTAIAMTNVLDNMSNNNKIFITKAEFKQLYNKFYCSNTQFANYFQEELGAKDATNKVVFAEKNQEPIQSIHKNFADPILVNALEKAWDNTVQLKTFSTETAGKAKVAVANNLDGWNLKASKLNIEAGNEHFIIVKADYNTPKGITSFFVPVEIVKNKALEPELFMSNAGPQDLNHLNIKNYITTHAGTKLKVRAEDILNVLMKEIFGENIISNVEMAATKIAASKENTAFDGIFGQSAFENPRADVLIPKKKEANSFEAKLSKPSGQAEFKFGNDKVNLGRDLIVRKLAGFGIKNSQINVVSSDDNTIFYGVSLFNGKTAFKVPVKLANNKILSPDLFLCNGSVSSFNKENITNLLVENIADAKMVAATSPQHDLSPAELIENVKSAVMENNYAKAEDALNILQQSGNSSAYKDAFACYLSGMNIKKSASKETTCSMIIKSASSSHPMCGHTNLPTHKVYQDEHGNCQPLYRKGMKETSEAAFFMNYKILG